MTTEFFGAKTINRIGYLGFPPYEQEAFEAPYVVEVCMQTEADMKKFCELTGIESILENGIRSAKSIWFPRLDPGERGSNALFVWIEED